MDLVGNVWQWTDEFQDEHTRAAILRGGSYYQPQGSCWYFPRPTARRARQALLMAPSNDRSAAWASAAWWTRSEPHRGETWIGRGGNLPVSSVLISAPLPT